MTAAVRHLHPKKGMLLVSEFDGVRFMKQWSSLAVLRLVLALGLESDSALRVRVLDSVEVNGMIFNRFFLRRFCS